VTILDTATRAHLDAALTAICQQAGVEPSGAHLIRYTMNAVFRLDPAGVVVRMTNGPGAAQRAARVAATAQALAALDLPTARLAAGIPQPVHAHDWSATIWTLLPQPRHHRFAPVDLATPLRALHAVRQPPAELPRWNLVPKIRSRLTQVRMLRGEHQRHMQHWATRDIGMPLDRLLDDLDRRADLLEAELDHTNWHLPPGLIHGDAHTGNLLTTAGHQTILCDLDSVAVGPREWDLTPAAHGPVRFGRDPGEHAAFVGAYGLDVTTLGCWGALRYARELQLVTSVITDIPGRPAMAQQLASRLRSILTEDLHAIWERYE